MKRILTLLLVLCIGFTLVSCSQAPTSTSAPTPTTAPEVDPYLGAYKDTVVITTVKEADTTLKWAEGDDIKNNIWTRSVKEKLNVDIQVQWESNEYDTKLNLAITSGSLPDAFNVKGPQLRQLIDAGLIMDLSEIYGKYLNSDVKAYHESDVETFDSGKQDGKLYGIAQLGYGTIIEPDYIWLRKDWMEESGLKAPATVADLEKILLAFMEKHGGYGLASDQTLNMLNMLAPAWHAYPVIWVKTSDGSIGYGAVQPEMKAALSAWADWYKKGILNKSFPTQDEAAVKEDVVTGKVGAQPYYQWWGWGVGIDQVNRNGRNTYLEPYSIPSVDGKAVYAPAEFGNFGYVVVNKNCKNPEAIFKMMNYYNYIRYNSVPDIGAAKYKEYVHDSREHFFPFRVVNPLTDAECFKAVQDVLYNGKDVSTVSDPVALENLTNIKLFKDDGNTDGLGRFLQMGSERCSYKFAVEYIDSDRILKSMLWGETPEVLASYGSTLTDLLTEGFTKIIIGEEPIDYFDTVVANWKAAGGDKVTVAMNERYGS